MKLEKLIGVRLRKDLKVPLTLDLADSVKPPKGFASGKDIN
jgi:hypothetical protein